MKRFCAACVLLLLVPASARAEFTADQLLANAGVQSGPEYQSVAEAFTRFDKQDFTAAQAMLIAAKQKHPELPPGHLMLAELLLSRNQFSMGRRELELTTVSDPTDPEAFLLLGEMSAQDGRIAEANLVFEHVRKLADGSYGATPARKNKLLGRTFAGLAAVNESRQNWTQAQAYLTEWLNLDPQNAAAHERLGQVLFQLGKAESAYKEFEIAAKSPANTVPALSELLMGQLYERAGNRANATKWMNAATRLSGDNLPTQLAVARWAFQTNQLPEAATHAQAALALDAKSLDALLLCGTLALLQHDRASAEKYLETAALESPTNFEAGNLLALTLCDEVDTAKQQRALALARANVDRFPRSSEALATLGWVLQRQGRQAESEQALNRAAGAGPLNTNAIFFVATMLERQGHRAEAASLLAKALEGHQPFLYKDQAEKLVARLQVAARAAADEAAAKQAAANQPAAGQTPGVRPNPIRPDASGSTADTSASARPAVTKPDPSNSGSTKPAGSKPDPKGVDPFNDLPPVKP
jgi:tetratricopeptide (TPR) repeat protein